MKAAVVRQFNSPVVIEDRPIPEPGPGQVLVKIEASGLCHTDIHAANGDWPVKPAPPFVPGHEGVGIVQRLGEGVTSVREGERVAIPWLGWACGECDYCITGWETLCERQKNTGYAIDGGWGEYARIAGAQVVAVDLVDEKLHMAKELGAAYTVNAREQDPVAAIKALGGADAAISLAVSPKAFEQAYGSLRRGGTLVFVGLPADNEIKLPIFETVLNGTKVVGSIVGTRRDLRDVFELHQAGLTKVEYERRRLEDVNQAMHDVEHAAVKARVVFDLT
ncbi:MAG TPA: zinc-dependent alcohol dehydrogenase [Acidimicrobiales bacterium]|nr:zinc-dependent alcohol dehydrogenase [Acidimicrobiales bacterium]